MYTSTIGRFLNVFNLDLTNIRSGCGCRDRMEALIVQNNKLAAIAKSDAPKFVKNLQKLPVYERFAKNLLQVRVILPVRPDGCKIFTIGAKHLQAKFVDFYLIRSLDEPIP